MSVTLKLILSGLLTVALCALVIDYLDAASLKEALLSASPRWLIVSLLSVIGYQLLRAARMISLTKSRTKLGTMFNTMCLHGFLNSNLPAGLGDAALVFLLNKRHDVRLSQGAANVFIARLIDLCLFCIAFGIILVAMGSDLPGYMRYALFAFLLLFAGISAAIAVLTKLVRAGKINGKFASKAERLADEVQNSIRAARKGGLLGPVCVLTCAMWLCMYTFFFSSIAALNYPMSRIDVLLLYLLLFPVKLIPVKGIANLGTHEASWFAVLQLLGADSAQASMLSFGSHAIFFAVTASTLIFPFCSYIVYKVRHTPS